MFSMMRSPGFEKRASGRTLLVVEDDADIRDALDGLLSMEGFRVTGCSNGREALDWLHASPKPDLILLDLMMPIMDGWQFRVAQKEDPELATIPVWRSARTPRPKPQRSMRKRTSRNPSTTTR